LPFYFSKDNRKLEMKVLGSSGAPNIFLHLLKQFKPDDDDVTLYPLLKDQVLSSMYSPMLEAMERTEKPKTLELYLRFRQNQDSESRSFICHYNNQFLSKDMLTSFVNASCRNDVFFAFRIFVSRTGRPDINYIARELSYIGNYAQHRAKALESKLWDIVGVADLIDISEEVMVRMGCTSETIKAQQEKRAQLI